MINLNKTEKLVLVVFLVFVSVFYFRFFNGDNKAVAKEIIGQIKQASSLDKQAKLYREMIEKIGPEYAQEELYRSGLPFNGQTHLLNHVIGDYLYEKYGSAGLVKCRDYFLSSCYHGFVLHVIGKDGMTGVAKTFNECLKHGPAVYAQCAHAVGHGFLANAGYKNLTKALETCDQAIRDIDQFPAFNCYDGVFMENIWAVHEDGSPSPDRWVKKEDPFFPCNDPRIGDKYQLGCWSNQPTLMYQLFGGDIQKVGLKCDQMENDKNKEMCFDGLARQIHPITHGSVSKVFELCGLMPSFKWNNYCVGVNALSSYGVGDRISPFELCANIHPGGKRSCYDKLFSIMKAYKKDGEDLKKLCLKISDLDLRKQCELVSKS